MRSSAIDMLLIVKSISTIRFFDVAPMELLLARLPVEGPIVSGKIVSLLLDTYCPQNDPKVAVNRFMIAVLQLVNPNLLHRCLSFLESDPRPCGVFYSHIHKFVPLVFVCKLMGLLFRIIKNKGAGKHSASGEGLGTKSASILVFNLYSSLRTRTKSARICSGTSRNYVVQRRGGVAAAN